VDEWWRLVAPGGHLVVLDTPNRAFPVETHPVGLPAIPWLPPRLAFAYARLARAQFRGVSLEQFDRHGRGATRGCGSVFRRTIGLCWT
jgi:hypothetical protein